MKKQKIDIEVAKLIGDYGRVVFELFDFYRSIYLAEKSIQTPKLGKILIKFNSNDGISVDESKYFIDEVSKHNLKITMLVNIEQ